MDVNRQNYIQQLHRLLQDEDADAPYNNQYVYSSDKKESWSETEEGISGYLVAFVTLLAIVLLLSKFLHDQVKLSSLLPEAGLIIIVGILASFLIYVIYPSLHDVEAVENGLLTFPTNFFFEILLPPIIFNSGYHVNRKLFYRHIRPILLYSLLGTLINILVTASILHLIVSSGLAGEHFQPTYLELLTYGSLIASTDPVAILSIFKKKRVDPQCFYLVFGESVLNDGICLVLFESFSYMILSVEGNNNDNDPNNDYNTQHVILELLYKFTVSFIGSSSLGFISGMIVAFILKNIDFMYKGHDTRLLEMSFYVLVMYLPQFYAESLGLSGIVTILFTGISSKRYAEPNLTHRTRADAEMFFRVISHLSETAIFLELGLSLFALFMSMYLSSLQLPIKFIFWSLLTCLIGRACAVYPVTLLTNSIITCKDNQRRKKQLQKPVKMFTVNTPTSNSVNSNTKTNPVYSFDAQDDGYGTDDDSVIFSYESMPRFEDEYKRESNLKIQANTAHMIWFAGLRGAVAYACSKNFPDVYGNRYLFTVITMSIVFISVFALGCTSELVLDALQIETGIDESEYMEKMKRDGCIKHSLFTKLNERYFFPFLLKNYGKENTQEPVAVAEAMPSSPSDELITSQTEQEPKQVGISGDIAQAVRELVHSKYPDHNIQISEEEKRMEARIVNLLMQRINGNNNEQKLSIVCEEDTSLYEFGKGI